MPNRLYTTFQNLSRAFDGSWKVSNGIADLSEPKKPEDVVYTTTDPEKYQVQKLEMQQNRYLQNRWIRAQQNLSMSAFANLSNVKLMYMDADLMDSYPEIGAALDLMSEEATQPSTIAGGQIKNLDASKAYDDKIAVSGAPVIGMLYTNGNLANVDNLSTEADITVAAGVGTILTAATENVIGGAINQAFGLDF